MSGTNKDKDLGEGGAKERDANGDAPGHNPALQKENRQAVKNQSSVKPEQYPDRGEPPA